MYTSLVKNFYDLEICMFDKIRGALSHEVNFAVIEQMRNIMGYGTVHYNVSEV